MGKEMIGTVIEKSFRPPPGAPAKHWCYLMIETDSGERVTIRVHKKYIDQVTIDDRISFTKYFRKNKKVRNVQIIKKSS